MKRICALIIFLFAVMHLCAQDIMGHEAGKDGQTPCSQFRVVDANTREPIAGAYVFDKAGKLIEVTKADGMVAPHDGHVSISLLSYESVTIDAATQRGDVEMKEKLFSLGELVVTPQEYIKISGVFRDVFRNDGELTIYREGMVDFYYNTKSKEYTRRVRACRQYSDRRLDNFFNYSIYLGPYASFDMRRLMKVESDGITEQHGDTTVVGIKGGVNDAIIEINNKENGIFRTIIDGTKSNATTSTIASKYKTCIFDWTYRDSDKSLTNMLAYNSYIMMDYRNPMKGLKSMEVTKHNEFVVTNVECLSKADAKREMKDKSQTSDFVLPDILPALNFDLVEETKNLKQTKFDEYK